MLSLFTPYYFLQYSDTNRHVLHGRFGHCLDSMDLNNVDVHVTAHYDYSFMFQVIHLLSMARCLHTCNNKHIGLATLIRFLK